MVKIINRRLNTMMSDKPIKLQKAWMLVCLIEKYYETDPTGGCVHIITDDGNYGKGYAKGCIEFAKEQNDYWGEVIATLLSEFTEEEQEQIIERSWEIREQVNSQNKEQLCENLNENFECNSMCLTRCIEGNKFWK